MRTLIIRLRFLPLSKQYLREYTVTWPSGYHTAHDVNIGTALKPHTVNLDQALLLCCQFFVPRCSELHADWQPGAEEVGLPLLDELRQEPTWHGHHGCQQLCQGKALNGLDLSFQLCLNTARFSQTVTSSISVEFYFWVTMWTFQNEIKSV